MLLDVGGWGEEEGEAGGGGGVSECYGRVHILFNKRKLGFLPHNQTSS